jgi:Reverse transcriptase (RNA-dependent DNA polymerase)
VFRARLVACGYIQVPGIDFNESFAPVINDVSFRIMLIVKLVWKLQASVIDVETAFLHGNLKEEVYMNIPEGMESNGNECLLLNKRIYRLVQSAREFFKWLIEVLKSVGFIGNKSDPCLLSKWDKEGAMLIGIYVDECIVIGKEEQIFKLVDYLKTSGFNLKIENNLTDYLSCHNIEHEEKGEILVIQPHFINCLIEKFGDEVKDRKFYKLLACQGSKLFDLIVIQNLSIEKFNKDTVQELVCYFISKNIQDLISATLSESYQSAWMELQ